MNAAALVAAFPVSAADFKLSVPIECDLRTECYIQQYVDHDPSPNASDFTCSHLSMMDTKAQISACATRPFLHAASRLWPQPTDALLDAEMA